MQKNNTNTFKEIIKQYNDGFNDLFSSYLDILDYKILNQVRIQKTKNYYDKAVYTLCFDMEREIFDPSFHTKEIKEYLQNKYDSEHLYTIGIEMTESPMLKNYVFIIHLTEE